MRSILCLVGLHQWWRRIEWPLPSGSYGVMYSSAEPLTEAQLAQFKKKWMAQFIGPDGPSAVCGRCSARQFK